MIPSGMRLAFVSAFVAGVFLTLVIFMVAFFIGQATAARRAGPVVASVFPTLTSVSSRTSVATELPVRSPTQILDVPALSPGISTPTVAPIVEPAPIVIPTITPQPMSVATSIPSPQLTKVPPSADDVLGSAISVVERLGYGISDARHFNPSGPLQVLIGVRLPTADAHDRRAFFFVNGAYIGTDAFDPSADLSVVWQSQDTVTLSYVLFRPGDARCCPTGGTSNVPFQWRDGRLYPLAAIPSSDLKAALSRR
jgi:hypothetical protein